MTKPFRCGGPIGSTALVAPGATMLTRFTPQRRFVVDGCALQRGWEVISVRRVGFAEIVVGMAGFGSRSAATFRPRPDVDLPYRVESLGDGCVVHLDGPDVCISEALEMVVRNGRAESAALKAWWIGETDPE